MKTRHFISKLFYTTVRSLSSDGRDKTIPFNSLPMKTRVKKKLEEKGFPFRQGYTNFIMECPFCTKSSRSLYVDMDSGTYSCQPCCKTGSWIDLCNWTTLGDTGSVSMIKKPQPKKEVPKKKPTTPKSSKVEPDDTKVVQVKLNEYLEENTREFSSTDKVLMDKALGTTSIDLSTIMKFNLRVFKQTESTDEDNIILCWPWYNSTDQELIGLKKDPLNKTKDTNPITYCLKDGRVGLFGWNMIRSESKTVVLTAREVDVMALAQDCKAAALALPQGLTTLPPELLPQLETFDNIILWLGDDVRARQAALQFAKKLNLKRCYIVRKSTDSALDTPFTPLNLLNEGKHLGEILESSLKLRHDKIITFCDIRSDVWYELYHSDEIQGLRWERYPDLNRLLKGYRRGELSIYTGQTGSGKTTLLSELSLDLCIQNVCTLWGSFEISATRLAKTMLRQYSRVNLEENNKLFETWADKYESLPMYFMNFYGATKIEDIIETMHYAVYMYDVEHVIVDNLQFMVALEFQNDKYYVQDKIVAALRRFATEKDVHVSLVVHPRKERDDVILEKSSVYGTAKAIQEADNILILHSNPGQSKALEVSKNRFDGTLGLVRLQYNPFDSTFSNRKSSGSNILALLDEEKW